MIPTTLRTVAADFATQIRQITPDYPLLQDQTWSPVERQDLVPCTRFRTFHCEWTAGVPQEDGIYGSAIEYVSSLFVWTNYSGLHGLDGETQDMLPEVVTSDARQLWLTLEARCDPVVDGVLYVNPLGWIDEDDEDGYRWGYHEFEVRYLLSHTL